MIKIHKTLSIKLGLLLLILSAVAYFLELQYFEPNGDLFTTMFFVHYALAMAYYLISWRVHGRSFFNPLSRKNLKEHTLLLLLFNIAAYSLNKGLPVFHESVEWLTAFLILESLLLVAVVIFENLPRWASLVTTFFLGWVLLFNIYQGLMVIPIVPVGIIGSVLLGVGLLAMVPGFFIIISLRHLELFLQDRIHKIVFISTFPFCFALVGTYMYQWKSIDNQISDIQRSLDVLWVNADLPEWIRIAQNISPSPLTEKYLKSGLVYQNIKSLESGFWGFGSVRYNDRKQHDPLVTLSSISTQKQALDNPSKIKVLNYLYNARHQSGDRFWSGENLATSHITTNVQFFPEERLAYTEQMLSISNNRPQSNSRWSNLQEAFYTFDLPEGGVVTSLSLWINGIEQKGILTSKKKAQKAYNTIVGREARDPSVVYWMEGNRIRVRVFPCTPLTYRKFKVGITSPLTLTNDKLTYKNITFQGPDHREATSSINLLMNGAEPLELPKKFVKQSGSISYQGSYEAEWHLSIRALPIPKKQFSFGGEHFSIAEAKQTFAKMSPDMVYLDLNNQWTKAEIDGIKSAVNAHKIKVLTHSMDIDNQQAINNLKELPNFSLFPFHKLAENDKNVVITKGGMATPNLSDLKDSPFKKKLFSYFKSADSPVLVLDLASTPSDYMRSLKEFGVVNYHSSDLKEIHQYSETGLFPASPDGNALDIPGTGMSIIKSTRPNKHLDRGSDHLMRLYYYNQVMNEIGTKYFADSKNAYLEDHLVDMATTANIVTPLSSLIVLETQQDYERFGIARSKDSLANASMNNSGAVPEPHEWALIIIGSIFIGLMLIKRRNLKFGL